MLEDLPLSIMAELAAALAIGFLLAYVWFDSERD